MARVNVNGYFDAEDSEEQRYQKKVALNAQRIKDFKTGEYALGGGVVDPLPEDAPFFVKDYHDYYKTKRGYHQRSLNSNGGGKNAIPFDKLEDFFKNIWHKIQLILFRHVLCYLTSII